MIAIRIIFAIFLFSAVLGCREKEQGSLPHPAATLLAGVTGHLETCRLLLADRDLTQKDVLEFAPIGLSFARDKSIPADTPPEIAGPLSERQAGLQACVQELNHLAGIKAAR